MAQRIAYFDTASKQVESYLEVGRRDCRALVQALMLGGVGNAHYAFISHVHPDEN